MDVVLYHFEGQDSSFTGLKDINDVYPDHTECGIVYSYSHKRLNVHAGDALCGVEFTMITQADRFTSLIQQYLHHPQHAGQLDLVLEMFYKDESKEDVELVPHGKLTLQGCVFIDSSIFYLGHDFNEKDLGSVKIKGFGSKQVQNSAGAVSMPTSDVQQNFYYRLYNTVWQKTILRCYDYQDEMQTSDGTIAIDSLRFLDLLDNE